MFPDFSPFAKELAAKNIKTSEKLCEHLFHETAVAMLPGRVFERPCEELTARISYINFSGAESLAASETIAMHHELPQEFIQAHCEDTLRGMEILTEWLTS
jgi:aspartate aminotransferase